MLSGIFDSEGAEQEVEGVVAVLLGVDCFERIS